MEVEKLVYDDLMKHRGHHLVLNLANSYCAFLLRCEDCHEDLLYHAKVEEQFYVVARVSRDDVAQQMDVSTDITDNIPDEDMEDLAERMGEAYSEGGYWDHLAYIVEDRNLIPEAKPEEFEGEAFEDELDEIIVVEIIGGKCGHDVSKIPSIMDALRKHYREKAIELWKDKHGY